MTFVEKIKAAHQRASESVAVRSINRIINSPLGIVILAACTAVSFAFSLELYLYTAVIIYSIYVTAFCDDFKPLLPLFVFCYVAPSISNNPGKTEQSLFYGATGIYLICLVVLVLIALILRLSIDKEIGFRRFFSVKRTLLVSILALGTSYFLSGIGSEKYLEYVKSNLFFAFIQFASIFLLYFVFSVTVKWDKMDLDYFAWAGLMMGVLVAVEVGIIYISEDVIVDGTILRGRIYSGWGCYNNIGAIISMSIPFAFYFACRKQRSSLYLILGCLLTAAVVFSCSRGSMVGAAFAFLVSFVYTFFKAENKKEFRISSLAIFGILSICAILFWDQINAMFNKVPSISDINDGSISFNDSGRFGIYLSGLEVYLDYPIFGQTFYPASFPMYDFSDVEQFSSFFPPRWHNTVIQMLASCGTVGMLAYSYHRIDTIRLFWKKRTTMNVFIAISILTLLGMSLLDCHFFNVGPVLFYSIALAVMEFGVEKPAKI